ncbi:hypothetical protein BV20DRAFT_563668 [Pilatotrama ljubarskyi]|nr:hypothetical protein BV20DRAFT_563668 [Pilatotrama ljubarskyi]
MPHRRLPSTGTCEVVPGVDELPCALMGYGERPRLCGGHRKEYARLTMSYKECSHLAEGLYKEVKAKDWTDEALWRVSDLEAAMLTAASCIDALEREITEREEHHRRFFVELDDGHEAWIARLRKKLREVRDIAAQLLRCKDTLIEDERRRADKKRRAEERRKVYDAWRSPTYSPWHSPSATNYSPSYYDDYRYSSERYAPATPARNICVAYLTNSAYGQYSRCTREAGSYYASRCEQHEYEYDTASEQLRSNSSIQARLAQDINILRRSLDSGVRPSFDKITEDIAKVSRYIVIVHDMEVLQVRIHGLNGKTASYATDYQQDRYMATNLKRRLKAMKSDIPSPMNQANEGGSWTSTLFKIALLGLAAYWFWT